MDNAVATTLNSVDGVTCPMMTSQMMDDLPYDMGMFIWTGQDYLGEPTPYYSYWPSRSSYFGAVDLAGLPKDRFYLYKSVWNKKEPTLHLLPHWNWEGREVQNHSLCIVIPAIHLPNSL